ncbi:MAG: hypothetical protein MJ225_00975 [Bacilli bacterium]|nr:hypothetical protein [Bacilli bacterium]
MYRIALKEKALLDFLYKVKPIIRTKKEMLGFLFENMRISEIVLDRLDKNILIELQPYYHSSNVNLFMNMYLKGELHD